MTAHHTFPGWIATADVILPVWVEGSPAPQGSLTAYAIPGKGARIVQGANPDSRARLLAWRELVGYTAREAMRGRQMVADGPVMCSMTFCLPRKTNTPKRAHTWPCRGRSLDLDKLVRAVCDALTGVAFADDAQVVGTWALKRWADEGQEPGVMMSVWQVE